MRPSPFRFSRPCNTTIANGTSGSAHCRLQSHLMLRRRFALGGRNLGLAAFGAKRLIKGRKW